MNEGNILIEARKRFVAKLESQCKENNGRSELRDEVVASIRSAPERPSES